MSAVEDRLLTVGEVAAYLRVSEATIYRLLQQGVLPGVKVGTIWRVSERSLRGFLLGGETQRMVSPKEVGGE